jgi:hypothetical protein
MNKHIQIVGILHIVSGLLNLAVAAILFVMFSVAGGIALSQGEHGAAGIVGIVGLLIGVFLALLSLPGIIGGAGLLAEKAWAGILVIIVGVFHLFSFPFGTALGIYTLWALLREDCPLRGGRPLSAH